jgi:hypothetical protein
MAYHKLLTRAAGALALTVLAGRAEAAPAGALNAGLNADNAGAIENVTWRYYGYGYRPYSYYRPYNYSYPSYSYYPSYYSSYSYYPSYYSRPYCPPYSYSYAPYYYRGYGGRYW